MKKAVPSKLFRPLKVGAIGTLSHRVVLAPLTRNRASEPGLVASPLAVQYYRQRASEGGLLITEATHISSESLAYPSTPGIWSVEQAEGWKKVTSAVHEKKGFLVCQLWHTGRVAHPDYASHPSNTKNYQTCVSSSAVGIVNRHGKPGKTVTYGGIKPHGVPSSLDSKTDIPRLCQDYKLAAQRAMDAGFDGVELHAAHGYLIDQFLNNGTNQRTDEYGGSVENRCRLLREVLDAIFEVCPSERVGVRLSPHDSPNGGNTYYGSKDTNPDLIYRHAIQTLDRLDLAYLLLTEPRWVGKHDDTPENDPGFQMPLMNLEKFRQDYHGVMIGAGGFTPSSSYAAMGGEPSDKNQYDALAFGRWFISNPDLPLKLECFHQHLASGSVGLPPPPLLNRYERDTFYTRDAGGYIDYPSLEYETFCEMGSPTENDKLEYQGMELGKYTLLEQENVGTSLKTTETQSRSKL
eukprot:CAMPEP_0172317910 /NCGR_PEP_ID=MMETSP1058-20130122/33267_1 /TAXON_ID=83371 /ORGANISM="Detonula confervacea, Strain CCMP 353" /LENGTH=462 /DNA_ID=CAMNT_0013032591 /DNA_START=130 /DNA_END=1518 /DNA_ORIENTATION=+